MSRRKAVVRGMAAAGAVDRQTTRQAAIIEDTAAKLLAAVERMNDVQVRDLADLSDEQLIERARQADHAAYTVLIDRYKEAGYRGALAILRHPSDAEDALQEAFIKAYVYL
ncbi:MAG: hypothetical protein ACRDFS_07320, partial [Chloroflexota bacterium]